MKSTVGGLGQQDCTETGMRQQRQRVKLVLEGIPKTWQSLHLKPILHTVTAEVQQILQGDRAMMHQDLSGKTKTSLRELGLSDYPILRDQELAEVEGPTNNQRPFLGYLPCILRWGVNYENFAN